MVGGRGPKSWAQRHLSTQAWMAYILPGIPILPPCGEESQPSVPGEEGM